jgi:hypothetical protein
MHTDFRAQVTVGVVARERKRGAGDAGFFGRLVVDDLGLEALTLAPAQVHAHEHLAPVFGFDAARAGADTDDGVGVIDRPAQHAAQLGRPHLDVDRLHAGFDLVD